MFTVTRATPLTPEKRLALAMIVLAIQDLKLEKEYLTLKEFYVINKNRKMNKKNVFSTLLFLLSDREDNTYSFINCCNYLNVNPENIRDSLLSKVKSSKELTELYKIWKVKQTKGDSNETRRQ